MSTRRHVKRVANRLTKIPLTKIPLDASGSFGLNTPRKAGPFCQGISNVGFKIHMVIYGYLLMVSDALLILGGATMYWFSPRLRRNWVLGYGSPRSMINDTAWQAGNRFAGTALALLAVFAMLLHVSLWSLIETDQFAQTVSVGLILALPFLVMYLTEKYLARLFKN